VWGTKNGISRGRANTSELSKFIFANLVANTKKVNTKWAISIDMNVTSVAWIYE